MKKRFFKALKSLWQLLSVVMALIFAGYFFAIGFLLATEDLILWGAL